MKPCPILSHAGRVCWCALALLTMPACGPSAAVVATCDANDLRAQADLALLDAACIKRINACVSVACVDNAEQDCHRKIEERCK